MKALFKGFFATATIFSLVAFAGCSHDHCHCDKECKSEKKCCGKDGKCCKKKK